MSGDNGKGSNCPIRKDCEYWRGGLGSDPCLKCQDLEKQVGNGYHETEPFFIASEELVENVRADTRITSIFQVLRNVKPRDRVIFEDHALYGISMEQLAMEHNLSKSGVQRIIEKVRQQVRDELIE